MRQAAVTPAQKQQTQHCRTKAATKGHGDALANCTGQYSEENNVYFGRRWRRKDTELEGNQAGKLRSEDKSALRLNHKQGNYGVFSRVEDKQSKMVKGELKKCFDMSDKNHPDSGAPKQPTFIHFAAQGNLPHALRTC